MGAVQVLELPYLVGALGDGVEAGGLALTGTGGLGLSVAPGLAAVAGVFSQTAVAGSLLTRQALELASSLVPGAPVLLTATGVAFVIAVVRGITGRRRTA